MVDAWAYATEVGDPGAESEWVGLSLNRGRCRKVGRGRVPGASKFVSGNKVLHVGAGSPPGPDSERELCAVADSPVVAPQGFLGAMLRKRGGEGEVGLLTVSSSGVNLLLVMSRVERVKGG